MSYVILAITFLQVQPQIPETFEELIVMIGSPIFIAFVLSFMLKEWAWFRNQSPTVKWTVTLATAIVLPIISHALQLYLPVGVVDFLHEWWPYVAAGFGVWVSSQMVHLLVNRKLDKASDTNRVRESVFEQDAKK